MIFDLTPNQKNVLRWMVELAQADKIRDTFRVALGVDGGRIEGREELMHIDLDEGTLDALTDMGMLVRKTHTRHLTPSDIERWGMPLTSIGLVKGYSYRLTAKAYTAVETDFDTTTLDIAQPDRSGSLQVEVNRSTLIELITTRFDDSELKTLCFTLNVDYGDLGQGKKTDVTRELVLHMNRRGRLRELIAVILQERPTVDWSPLFKD